MLDIKVKKETAILFITFARDEYARLTFDQIKKAKPGKLYFYSNKARCEYPEEIKKNGVIRAFINEIDWECDLKIFFREKHADVYTSLWSAIDWLFENEERGIIIEEDCVPSLAFFDFCRQLLPKFETDMRIWLISGDNFFDNYNPNGYDYIFSRYPFQWGWASWRSRWQLIERNNIPWEKIKSYELYRQLFPSKREADFHIKNEEGIYNFVQKKPAWDFIMGFSAKNNGAFGIVPAINLVSNIGIQGTHNKKLNKLIHNRNTSSLDYYTIRNEPPFVVPDYKYDRYFFKKFHYKSTLLHVRFIKKMKRILNKIFS
ncbi:MAG: hypothetical protein A2455_15830 [Ignavibacteria bacterium RIFOXYC2_FULL_35_16]|nr:MAG: hypothetical protein A2X60_16085 [Ignavibacteria bacterium GWF2_35_20]OGU79620.1 MAG: hypothetical protein A2254_17155 [Ignavibacteria bacterium RIFOXYA2_FULL_35_9]OGU85767.1 MAG: hypothetical protein A3K31_00765 [Ignavibacteria bacterium RIFOXYA12_FULL_35_25]OGU93150.1 MAG: hypothetical protein A2347_08105 [Ignavibacteria bacterium RIFOXYB12_FULL_35_14]OGU98306.1 MAG: hypothetical protein A2455_15830 [Ignavibacteria bacterium RIFOXYC2_FULL_35_16]OGV31069.1 MAG: hypothetical protein A2